MANGNGSDSGWMADVQRALALIFVGSFCIGFLFMVGKVVFRGNVDQNLDILKIIIPAAITFVGAVIGYFYGSSKSKDQSDASQQRVVDKLTSAPPGTLPPNPTAPVPPWWGRLTDEEKNAITAASAGDPRIAAFVTASQVGAANVDDLNYLVSKNLLTQERLAVISAP